MIYLLAFLGLFIVLFGRALATAWREYRHRKRLCVSIPGDEGLPVFGNIFEIGRTPEEMPRSLLTRAKEERESMNVQVLKLWGMHHTGFFPLNGEMLQYILESPEEINKGMGYGFFESWLGRGLLLAGGDKWRARRRLLTPTFHFTMLLGYIETMNRHATILADILEIHIGNEFNIYPFMKRFTLDVICDTTMGKDLDSMHYPDQPYVKAISKLMYLGVKGTMSPHLWNHFGRWASGWIDEHAPNLKIAHDFTNKMIEERMTQLAQGKVDANKRALLDMLISEKERSNLSMEDIREEVDTFMFAGHDTTSTALGWTLWCFAHHQSIQDRAYEEISEIFGDDADRDCAKDDLSQLQYLERCIKESLRLFPSVPFVVRHLEEDFQMGPYLLPRSCDLIISPYMVHRNERIYPKPEIYDPDRFLPENSSLRHPYDYIPFSAGPRNCIGQKFAMYQMKISLSRLLRRYKFSSDRSFDSIPILAEVVLKAGDGINIVIENR